MADTLGRRQLHYCHSRQVPSLYLLFVFFFEIIYLCSLAWSGISCGDQSCLKLTVTFLYGLSSDSGFELWQFQNPFLHSTLYCFPQKQIQLLNFYKNMLVKHSGSWLTVIPFLGSLRQEDWHEIMFFLGCVVWDKPGQHSKVQSQWKFPQEKIL